MAEAVRRLPEPATHVMSAEVIRRYAELSGDRNPLHVDEVFAAQTQFGTTIAHGPLAMQPCLVALGDWLDADALPAGVRLSARLRNPVPTGSEVTCEFEPDGPSGLAARCRTGEGVIVVEIEVEMASDFSSAGPSARRSAPP